MAKASDIAATSIAVRTRADGGPSPGLLRDALPKLTHLLAKLSPGHPLPDMLADITALTEQLQPGILCSILLVDPSSSSLRHAASPGLSPSFVAAIDGLPIGEGSAVCGTAAARGTPVIVADIGTDPLTQAFVPLARAEGVAACWSFPFVDDEGTVLGTLAAYSPVARSPSVDERQAIEYAARLAGIVVMHQRGTTRLADSERRYRQLANLAPTAVLVHHSGLLDYVNPAGAEFLGCDRAEDAVGQPLAALVGSAAAEVLLAAADGLLTVGWTRGTQPVAAEVAVSSITFGQQPASLLICREIEGSGSTQRRAMRAAERERRALALDLHDGLGQELTGISFLLAGLQSRAGAVSDAARDDLRTVQLLVNESIDHVRRLATALGPAELHSRRLGSALAELAQRLDSPSGTRVTCETDPALDALIGTRAALEWYRVAQEALANAMRHAGAKSIRLRLRRIGGDAELTVRDDGHGLAPGSLATPGTGIRSMTYRAHRLGGQLDIRPAQAGGTQVRLRCPLVRGPRAEASDADEA